MFVPGFLFLFVIIRLIGRLRAAETLPDDGAAFQPSVAAR
jgi:hypothetical protein